MWVEWLLGGVMYLKEKIKSRLFKKKERGREASGITIRGRMVFWNDVRVASVYSRDCEIYKDAGSLIIKIKGVKGDELF
jgi:hypothetical protein